MDLIPTMTMIHYSPLLYVLACPDFHWWILYSINSAATDASNELVQLASLILRFPRSCFLMFWEHCVHLFSRFSKQQVGGTNSSRQDFCTCIFLFCGDDLSLWFRLSAVLPIQVMSSMMVYGFIHNQRQGKQILLKLFLSQIMIFCNQDSSNELIDKGNYVKLGWRSLNYVKLIDKGFFKSYGKLLCCPLK